jgi:translation initiation factor 3 subunit H
LDCADVQQQEQNNYQYWQRSVAREQAKMQAWLAKRVSSGFFFRGKE